MNEGTSTETAATRSPMNAKQIADLDLGLNVFHNRSRAPVLRLAQTDLRKRYQSETNNAFAALPWLSNAGAAVIDRTGGRYG